MHRKYVFIRDDDIYRTDRIFLKISEFLLKEKIPTSYAIIPAKLQKSLISYLKIKQRLHPLLIDILQHGYRHINYSPKIADKYEFGKLRSYFQQKNDIAKGFNRLSEAFGDMFFPCFVPPYHGYNITTLKILNKLGFSLFSADRIVMPGRFDFKQLPTTISLNDYAKEGTPLCIPFDMMAKRFLHYLNSCDDFLGIVFHHHVIKRGGDLDNILRFFLFLKKMEQRKYIILAPISKISRLIK